VTVVGESFLLFAAALHFRAQLLRTKKRARRDAEIDLIRKLYVKAGVFGRGQTMAEYALILAAVAVIVFVGYLALGTTITTLLTTVDTNL